MALHGRVAGWRVAGKSGAAKAAVWVSLRRRIAENPVVAARPVVSRWDATEGV
jgi:hypothetical protein